jgi:hypothetical protein
MYPFSKKPAFFPFVSAEVFFEANEAELKDADARSKVEIDDESLDNELDKILGLSGEDA